MQMVPPDWPIASLVPRPVMTAGKLAIGVRKSVNRE